MSDSIVLTEYEAALIPAIIDQLKEQCLHRTQVYRIILWRGNAVLGTTQYDEVLHVELDTAIEKYTSTIWPNTLGLTSPKR